MRLDLLVFETLDLVVEFILVGLKDARGLADGGEGGRMGEDLIEVFYRIIIVWETSDPETFQQSTILDVT